MASEVDICNMALSELGDQATVSSIDPPEGSAQAGKCARWYPICLDLMLEADEWSFARRRAPLALLDQSVSTWRYVYARPADCVKAWAVLPPDALNDYSVGFPQPSSQFIGLPVDRLIDAGAAYVPQDFTQEIDDNERPIILTNQENAVLRYTKRITDTTRFTPLFTTAFAKLLASYLAGPIIKGDAGRDAAAKLYAEFTAALAKASASDANARQETVKQVVPWIGRR